MSLFLVGLGLGIASTVVAEHLLPWLWSKFPKS